MVNSSYWKKALTYGALTVALAIGTPQAKSQSLESKVQTEYVQRQDTVMYDPETIIEIYKTTIQTGKYPKTAIKEYEEIWNEIKPENKKLYTPETIIEIYKTTIQTGKYPKTAIKEYEEIWSQLYK